MKPRKILKILAIIICAISIAEACMIYIVFQNYNSSLASQDRIDKVLSVIFQKRLVADDYLLYSNERAKEQWFVKQAEVESLISQELERTQDPEALILIRDIQARVLESHTIFNQIIQLDANLEAQVMSAATSQENMIRLSSQLTAKAQEAILLSTDLKNHIITESAHALRLLVILFSVALTLYLVLLIISFVIVWKSVGILQKVDEMKSDFVSLVSHQLKTPVAQIKGYVENMMDGLAGKTTVKQQEYLVDMLHVAEKNSKLIDDLLNISRIERGVLKVNLESLPLVELVNDVVSPLRAVAKAKGVILQETIPQITANIRGDSVKTREALRNIVDNAIKFTPVGKTVRVTVSEEPDRGIVVVKDEGIGIDPDVQKELFEKNRVWSGKVQAAGAGLGLFLSKQFIELTGGSIYFSTEQGRGTAFTINLPKAS